MDVSIHQSTPSYKLQGAILLYGPTPGNTDLVTLHDVAETKSGAIIKEGTPATIQALRNMLNGLTERIKRPLQLLHPNLIALNDECLVWWVPTQRQRIAFSCKELGKRAAVVSHPPLLFAVVDGAWYVFALPENKRPDAKSILAVAPYFNVWNGGHICVGSTALPKGDKRLNPDEWTKAFFESAFTHPNLHGKNELVLHPDGPFAFWRDMLDGKYADFPVELLVKTKQTVKDLLVACQKGASHA